MPQKTLMRGLAAATIALPVALANPTAVRSCGGGGGAGPNLNGPGSMPADKLESAQKKDLEDEPLPGLDDEEETSAPAPVETAAQAEKKPSTFKSAEADPTAASASASGGRSGSVTIGGTAGAATQSSQDDQRPNDKKPRGISVKYRNTPRLQVELNYGHRNPIATPSSSVTVEDGLAAPITSESALSLIEQDKGGSGPNPQLLAAYKIISYLLRDIYYYEKYPEEQNFDDYFLFEENDAYYNDVEINVAISRDMNTLMGLPVRDPRRVALIRGLRRYLTSPPTDSSGANPTRPLAQIPPLSFAFVSPSLFEEPELLVVDAPSPVPDFGDDAETQRELVESAQESPWGDSPSARNQARGGSGR